MESVFITENPMDINLFVSECNEMQKLKIGEIFQLQDSSLFMCCVHCLQEFQYFTEFSLHIKDHFMRDEVAQLREIKDLVNSIPQENVDFYSESDVNLEKAEIHETDIFDKELELVDAWTKGEFLNSSHSIFEPEINVKSWEKQTETSSFIEGTDYKQSNGKYRCLCCSHESEKWEHCKDHLLTHSNVRNILCPLCSKGFSAISYVRKHVNRTHKMKITADKIREAQPSFNEPSSSSSSVLIAPAKTSDIKSFVEGKDYEKSSGRFKCLTCGREILDHIKEHLLTHSNEKNIFCPICERPFIAVSYVRKHVNRAHKMKITADEIKTAQSMFDHITVDQNRIEKSIASVVLCQNKITNNLEKNFECFECHRQFMSLGSLRIHLKLHSGIKYACPHCDKVFAMRSYVRDHLVQMHKMKREEIPKDCIQEAIEKLPILQHTSTNNDLFPCHLCNNQYRKKQTLRQHLKTHNSDQNFLCVTCGAVYKSIVNLRYHMERHTDPNKRHKCKDCEKTYPTRRYMLYHYRTIHLKKTKQNPTKNQRIK